MKPDAYAMLAARQGVYWWHRARRSMSLAVMRRFGLASGCRWLDLGCGPGGNLTALNPIQPAFVTGVDLSPLAIEAAQRNAPGAQLVRADIAQGLPFSDASFDVVTIFNVLYHAWVPREASVLGEVRRVLRPGGLVLITEPAFSILSREMDSLTMGRKRYRLGEMDTLCRTAGLETVFGSYFTSFGLPILLSLKLVGRLLAGRCDAPLERAADMKPLPPIANRMFYWLASMEGRAIVRGFRVPFGTTLLCLARRPFR